MYKFLIASHTDIGTKKQVNQDAIFVEEAETDIGPVLLAAICDGMGGLSAGEVASAKMVEALELWFENSLAASMCRDGSMISLKQFQAEFDFMIRKTNDEIAATSYDPSGTTVTALLAAAGIYYTANVGDSRIYLLDDEIKQLTKDQTVVQQELDAGKITEADIKTHPQRSVLLQCVGASEVIVPDYTEGTYKEGDMFLLCSDGFRHVITKQEMEDSFYFEDVPSENDLLNVLKKLTDTNKLRGEKDNISAIAIKITQGERF